MTIHISRVVRDIRRPPTRGFYGRQRPSLWVSNVQRWKHGTNPYELRLGRSPTSLARLQRHWPISRSTWRRSSASWGITSSVSLLESLWEVFSVTSTYNIFCCRTLGVRTHRLWWRHCTASLGSFPANRDAKSAGKWTTASSGATDPSESESLPITSCWCRLIAYLTAHSARPECADPGHDQLHAQPNQAGAATTLGVLDRGHVWGVPPLTAAELLFRQLCTCHALHEWQKPPERNSTTTEQDTQHTQQQATIGQHVPLRPAFAVPPPLTQYPASQSDSWNQTIHPLQPIARKSSATATITRRSSSADVVDWATDTPAPTSGRPASTPVNLSLPSLSGISFSGLTSLLQDADETTNHWFVYWWTLMNGCLLMWYPVRFAITCKYRNDSYLLYKFKKKIVFVTNLSWSKKVVEGQLQNLVCRRQSITRS